MRNTAIAVVLGLLGACGASGQDGATGEVVQVQAEGKADGVTEPVSVVGVLQRGDVKTHWMFPGELHGWKITAARGEVVPLRVVETVATLRPVLRVYGPQAGDSLGSQLARDGAATDEHHALASFVAPADGVYLAVVGQADNRDHMDYQIGFGTPPVREICAASGGQWLDTGACGCGEGYFVASQGGCKDALYAQTFCEAGYGTWVEGEGCTCLDEAFHPSAISGTCVQAPVLCAESGGAWVEAADGTSYCQ